MKRTAASRQSHQKGPYDPKVIDCTASYLMLSVVIVNDPHVAGVAGDLKCMRGGENGGSRGG